MSWPRTVILADRVTVLPSRRWHPFADIVDGRNKKDICIVLNDGIEGIFIESLWVGALAVIPTYNPSIGHAATVFIQTSSRRGYGRSR